MQPFARRITFVHTVQKCSLAHASHTHLSSLGGGLCLQVLKLKHLREALCLSVVSLFIFGSTDRNPPKNLWTSSLFRGECRRVFHALVCDVFTIISYWWCVLKTSRTAGSLHMNKWKTCGRGCWEAWWFWANITFKTLPTLHRCINKRKQIISITRWCHSSICFVFNVTFNSNTTSASVYR